MKSSSTSTKYSFPFNLQNQCIQSFGSSTGNLLSLFEPSSDDEEEAEFSFSSTKPSSS